MVVHVIYTGRRKKEREENRTQRDKATCVHSSSGCSSSLPIIWCRVIGI